MWEAENWEHRRTGFGHGGLKKVALLPLVSPSSSDPALLCREPQSSFSMKYGAMMDRGCGQGLSGEGTEARRGSLAAHHLC